MDDVRYEHHLKHRGRANRRIAEVFWLAVCLTALGVCLRRMLGWWTFRYRSNHVRPRPSLLSVCLSRKLVFFSCFSQLSIPYLYIPLGRFVFLLSYTVLIVTILLSVDAPTFTFHFTDDVGFRAAWTTLSQIPLLYLISTKRGPLNYLTGLSYARINHLHRWVGRMVFVSATVHGSIMISSISIDDLLKSPEKAMQVVRYGVAAYTLLAWIAVSSILGIRRRWYTIFFLNHWVSTIVFLGIALKHVPSYARVPIYASIAIVAMDKSMVVGRYLWCNMTLTAMKSKGYKKLRSDDETSDGKEMHVLAMGHPVKMVWLPGLVAGEKEGNKESSTVIRIADVPFRWRPGQHVRVWIPRLGALEVHPFTPATCSSLTRQDQSDEDFEEHGLLPPDTRMDADDMVLMIKAHSGLTKRLADYRDQWRSLPCPNASQPSSSLVAFLDGPYGNAPAWEQHQNLVMVATSTGVSFNLSVLNYLERLCVASPSRLRTQRINFVWTNRHIEPQFEAVVIEQLTSNSIALRESGVIMEAGFYTACSESVERISAIVPGAFDPFAHLRGSKQKRLTGRPPLRIRNPNQPEHWESDEELEETYQESPCSDSDAASRSSEDTYVEEPLEEEQPCLPELDPPPKEDRRSSNWRSLIPSIGKKNAAKAPKQCQCALSRYQGQKCRIVPKPHFLTRHYGERPDISNIVPIAVPRTSLAKNMLVVCGGIMLETDARKVVTKMNMEFAIGVRETGLDIHIESAS